MTEGSVRLAAVVPPKARERAMRSVVRHPDGGRDIQPPAAVLVLETDPARPELGASVYGYSAEGAPVRESWYLSADEARGCVGREYEGRLGAWRPLPAGASPLDALAALAAGADDAADAPPAAPEIPPG